MQGLTDSIDFIRQQKSADPSRDKEALQKLYEAKFKPTRARSVLIGEGYALRFSEARTSSFSNTVLSLSALKAHDHRPFVIVVVRDASVDFMLANTTFLRRISHSSHTLRFDNVKGSFNGSDIMVDYEGLANSPENFESLFALHSAFTWEDNLERLVEATNAIVGRDLRFVPNEAQKSYILAAPQRAADMLQESAFHDVEGELKNLVDAQREAILRAAQLENVNLRGNRIEQLLTGTSNAHDLGDIQRTIGAGVLAIDIKTKLLDRSSAPKAYNIDKMLAFLAEPGSVFAFYLIGVDTRAETVEAKLLPIFESTILSATVVQHHWAGRSSRGVTQLSGGLASVFGQRKPEVDVLRAKAFIEGLLAL